MPVISTFPALTAGLGARITVLPRQITHVIAMLQTALLIGIRLDCCGLSRYFSALAYVCYLKLRQQHGRKKPASQYLIEGSNQA